MPKKLIQLVSSPPGTFDVHSTASASPLFKWPGPDWESHLNEPLSSYNWISKEPPPSDSLSRNTHTTTQDSLASNDFKPWEPPTSSSQLPEEFHKGTSPAHSAGTLYTTYFSGPSRSNAPRYWIQPPKQLPMPMTSSPSAAIRPAYSNKPTWYPRLPRYSNLTSPIPNFAPTSSHTTGPT